jgi:hypothetical protein
LRRKKAENSHCHSEELATRNLKHPLLLHISFYEEIPRCARDDNSDFLRKHHLSATALLSFFQNLGFLKEQRLTIPPRGTRADGDQQKIFLSSFRVVSPDFIIFLKKSA